MLENSWMLENYAPSAPVTSPVWKRAPGSYCLSLLAVIFTTLGLLAVNRMVSSQEPGIYVRPYTGLYLLTVFLMTWAAGRIVGFFTLGLCVLTSIYFLLPPWGWKIRHPSDLMGLIF